LGFFILGNPLRVLAFASEAISRAGTFEFVTYLRDRVLVPIGTLDNPTVFDLNGRAVVF
jgi:hypothetical protein